MDRISAECCVVIWDIDSKMRSSILVIAVFICSVLIAQSESTEDYGNDRLAIAPVAAFGSSSFNDFGVGLSYEHFFDSKVALETDLTFGIENEMIQLMIGPKFYPRDHDKPVSYGLAPIFFVLQGKDFPKEEHESFPLWSDHPYPKQHTYQQIGFMLVNSVNMTLSEQIYFGIEAGIGVNYLNRAKSEDSDDWESNDPGGNRLFRISMGYRF